MEIRLAEPQDIQNGLMEILDDFGDTSELDDKLAEVLLLNMHGRVYVVVEDNRVIGTGTLCVEQKLIKNGGRGARIEDVVIDAKHRGNGYGKMLIEYLIEEAKRLRCYKINLNCTNENTEFYKSCGFHKGANSMRIDL